MNIGLSHFVEVVEIGLLFFQLLPKDAEIIEMNKRQMLIANKDAKKLNVVILTVSVVIHNIFTKKCFISIANALWTPHHSARCTKVQSNIE